MSDIDDELLALAGGDISEDEPEDVGSGHEQDSKSPPTPPVSSKKDTPAKGAGTRKAPAVKKAKQHVQPEDSEEEGQASSVPSSPSSQQSAPMDESDSDSDAPPAGNRAGEVGDDGDDVNKYPIDGLFINHAEKAEIMGMREVEREIKIAERREEIERIRQNRLLRHMVVSQDSKKRKAAAAQLEENQRKTARVRTKVGGTRVGETSSGIDSLRKAREERSNRLQQRELERGRRGPPKSPTSRRSASRDPDADSDVEWASPGRQKHRSRSPGPVEDPVPELRDVERVRAGRSRFAEVCFYPGFDEAITGCFVRINIGPDPRTGQDVYRMAVVKGFSKGRPYAMPNRQGHQFVVETYVKAAHGKALKDWPFIMCSDRPFTEAEWNRYKAVCTSEGVPLPKKSALAAQIDQINGLIFRPWTEMELSEKLERQNSLRVKYSGIERDRLQKTLDEARAAGDDEEAARLQDELDRIETPRLAFKTSLTPTKKKPDPSAAMSQQERLAVINRENRRRNAEAVRQAQLKDRARAKEAEERAHAAENGNDNDRLTPASPASGPSRAGTPANAASQPHLASHLAKLQLRSQNGIPTIHRPLMDDDIIGSLDLDIDVTID